MHKTLSLFITAFAHTRSFALLLSFFRTIQHSVAHSAIHFTLDSITCTDLYAACVPDFCSLFFSLFGIVVVAAAFAFVFLLAVEIAFFSFFQCYDARLLHDLPKNLLIWKIGTFKQKRYDTTTTTILNDKRWQSLWWWRRCNALFHFIRTCMFVYIYILCAVHASTLKNGVVPECVGFAFGKTRKTKTSKS